MREFLGLCVSLGVYAFLDEESGLPVVGVRFSFQNLKAFRWMAREPMM